MQLQLRHLSLGTPPTMATSKAHSASQRTHPVLPQTHRPSKNGVSPVMVPLSQQTSRSMATTTALLATTELSTTPPDAGAAVAETSQMEYSLLIPLHGH